VFLQEKTHLVKCLKEGIEKIKSIKKDETLRLHLLNSIYFEKIFSVSEEVSK
jgi:hypothetical protein